MAADNEHTLERQLAALKRARGWLNMIAQDRPETSDIHSVLAQVDEAIAASVDRSGEAGETRSGSTEGESAGRSEAEASPK